MMIQEPKNITFPGHSHQKRKVKCAFRNEEKLVLTVFCSATDEFDLKGGMLVHRKGLSVRVNSVGRSENKELKKEPVKHVNDKEAIMEIDNKENGGIPLKKTANAPSLTIYKDSMSSFCQHCGAKRSGDGKSEEKAYASTQTTEAAPVNVKEMLSSETPPIEYWMDLAEQRREALVETLDENKELCELVEVLQTEITRLSKIEESLQRFVSDIKALGVEAAESRFRIDHFSCFYPGACECTLSTSVFGIGCLLPYGIIPLCIITCFPQLLIRGSCSGRCQS
uniref:Geminin n=1 Tax=Echinococcus canadensis TaxID=519352 RepID=A0A915EYG4_9CEST